MFDALREFVERHRGALDDLQATRFAGEFGEIHRYLRLLEIILERYRTSCDAAFDAYDEFDRFLRGERVPGLDTDRNRATLDCVLLDIESYYVFGNILLDRVATVTWNCLGPGSKRWQTFGTMVEHLAGYLDNRQLEAIPPHLAAAAEALRADLTYFRHNLIAHKFDTDEGQRLSTSFALDSARRVIILGHVLALPQRGEVAPAPSSSPIDLARDIDAFLREWLAYLDRNMILNGYPSVPAASV